MWLLFTPRYSSNYISKQPAARHVDELVDGLDGYGPISQTVVLSVWICPHASHHHMTSTCHRPRCCQYGYVHTHLITIWPAHVTDHGAVSMDLSTLISLPYDQHMSQTTVLSVWICPHSSHHHMTSTCHRPRCCQYGSVHTHLITIWPAHVTDRGAVSMDLSTLISSPYDQHMSQTTVLSVWICPHSSHHHMTSTCHRQLCTWITHVSTYKY